MRLTLGTQELEICLFLLNLEDSLELLLGEKDESVSTVYLEKLKVSWATQLNKNGPLMFVDNW